MNKSGICTIDSGYEGAGLKGSALWIGPEMIVDDFSTSVLWGVLICPGLNVHLRRRSNDLGATLAGL